MTVLITFVYFPPGRKINVAALSTDFYTLWFTLHSPVFFSSQLQQTGSSPAFVSLFLGFKIANLPLDIHFFYSFFFNELQHNAFQFSMRTEENCLILPPSSGEENRATNYFTAKNYTKSRVADAS